MIEKWKTHFHHFYQFNTHLIEFTDLKFHHLVLTF